MSFFTLLNSTATFYRGSHKRMNEWNQCLSAKFGANKLKKLNTIGKTRTLVHGLRRALFRRFLESWRRWGCKQVLVCIDVLVSLSEIASSIQFNVTARDDAKTLMDKMLKFEAILTATTFNRIFAVTTCTTLWVPSNLWPRSSSSVEDGSVSHWKVEKINRNFPTVLNVATQFVRNANNRLASLASLNSDVEVEESLPTKRIQRRKLPFGETDDSNNRTRDAHENYQVDVYNVVMEQH